MKNKLKLRPRASHEDECLYLTNLAKENISINRHAFLLATGWQYMGRKGSRNFYANLHFDNPCLTFTRTEAWFITLGMTAVVIGTLSLTTPSAMGRKVPWYTRFAYNHFSV